MAEQHSILPLPEKAIDLTGQRFGLLSVVGYAGSCSSGASWVCQCDCKRFKTIRSSSLRSGRTRSCGCATIEFHRQRNIGHNGAEYHIWHKMIERCKRPESTAYHRYGGRGISVCERWSVYENFLADMGRRPSSKHSLDRINNDGNYDPQNCRWATVLEQSRNRSDNLRIEHQGVTLTLVEWSEKTGLSQATIGYRLRMGWKVEDALTRPTKLGVSFSTRIDQRTARHLRTEP
jgi:hypothetical protein